MTAPIGLSVREKETSFQELGLEDGEVVIDERGSRVG